MKKESGFIQIIAIIIIFIIIAFYLGKNPIDIWEKIKPMFEFILKLVVDIIDFLIRSLTLAWQKIQ